jgi:hypothetical protein
MFLKTGLSRQHSLRELSGRKFSHNLNVIWDTFKAEQLPPPEIVEFDATIAEVAKFEDIRYPDKTLKYGAQIIIDHHGQNRGHSSRSEPEYKLDVYEIDRLVSAIFGVLSLNPLFLTSELKPDVQAMLALGNPAAKQILPARARRRNTPTANHCNREALDDQHT